MKKVSKKSVVRKAEGKLIQVGLAGIVRHGLRELVLGGRLERVSRPRARTLDGQEVALPS